MPRVSVPVSDDTKNAVSRHPEDLGLDAGLPEGQRYAELIEAGIEARRAAVRGQRREAAFIEHGADPEHADAVAGSTAAALEPGGF